MSTLVPKFEQNATGAVNRVSTAKMAERISVLDFIPAGTTTSTTDCTAYIQSAVNYITTLGGGTLYFPSGTYLLMGKNNPINNNSRLTDGVTLTSNISIVGDGNSSIIKVDINCANGFVFGRFRTAITTAAASINNVIIRDIQFQRAQTTFFEQQYQCWIDSAVNVSIENVYFNGWSGDAIIIGNILNSDTSAWLQSYTDNIQITNCTFDGVDNNNRQAITLFSGTNIEISNNLIRNTTKSNEPGAIDIEPELTTNVIQNVNIHDNTFENIGGATGSISINLYANLSNKAYNISARNNTFFDISNAYVFSVSGIPQTTDIFPSNAPYEIVFDGNLCTYNTKGLFSVAGVNNCKIANNHFASGNGALISYYTGQYYQTQNLFITNNTFYSCNIQSTVNTGTPLIAVHGTLQNASINNNNFILCGIYNTSTSSFGAAQVFGFDGYGNSLTSSYIAIKDNIVNGVGAGYNTSYPPFYASSTLTNANTMAMFNNTYVGVGYLEKGDATSIYTQVNSSIEPGPVYLQPQAAPSNPKAGEMYYDSSTNKPYCWNGSTWNALF
jgi:hypothetical protein